MNVNEQILKEIRTENNQKFFSMFKSQKALTNMQKQDLLNYTANLQDRLFKSYEENTFLQSKVARIILAIAERFDADGVDDLTLPKKINFFYIITNASAVGKLLKEIIEIIKEKVPETPPAVLPPFTEENELTNID